MKKYLSRNVRARFVCIIAIIGIGTVTAQVVHPQSVAPKSDVTFFKCSQQEWSGGIVGRRGVRYHLSIQTPPHAKLDTLWIDSSAFPIVVQDTSDHRYHSYNTTVKKSKGKWVYSLTLEKDLSFDARSNRHAHAKSNVSTHPPKYSGAALLVYSRNFKRDIKPLKAFTTLLPLMYP